MDLNELGKRFIALGRALQDDDSTIDELVGLAMDCGVQLEFRIVPATPTISAAADQPTERVK